MKAPPLPAVEASSDRPGSWAKLALVTVAVVFFAIVTGFLWFQPALRKIHTLDVTIPPAKLSDTRFAMTIVVTDSGAYSVAGKILDLDGVKKMLTPDGAHPVHSVLIRASAGKQFGAVVILLDAVRGAGIQQVSVETTRENEPRK